LVVVVVVEVVARDGGHYCGRATALASLLGAASCSGDAERLVLGLLWWGFEWGWW
jgi:hypothetical protein